jgi:glycosyltransferase involved in cell wall biosynthesis
MQITIVTPSYQSAQTILDTLQSVQQQKKLPDQKISITHWIIDGLSKDQTCDIVNAHIAQTEQQYALGLADDQIEYHCHLLSEKDQGLYDAMNKGVLKAGDQDVVAILNSDDFYTDSFVISKIAQAFDQDDQLEMAYGDLVYVDCHDPNIVTRYYSSANFSKWKIRFGKMIAHPSTFIKKSTYQRLGLYDLSFRIAADFEWICRAVVQGIRSEYLPVVFVKMREGGVSNQSIKNRLKGNLEIVEACQKNQIYTNLLFILSKIPFKMLGFLFKKGF